MLYDESHSSLFLPFDPVMLQNGLISDRLVLSYVQTVVMESIVAFSENIRKLFLNCAAQPFTHVCNVCI